MRGLQSEEGHFGEEVKRKVDTFRPSFRELVYFCKIECGTKTSKITDSPPTHFNHLTKIGLEWPDSAKFSRNISNLKTRIWAISLVYELS